MPKYIYAEPGYDPTTADLPMRGLTLKGCVTIVGAILLVVCLGSAGVAAALPRLIPTKTPIPTFTPEVSNTPGPTPTSTITRTPTYVYTRGDIVIITKMVTLTFTPTVPTNTPTITHTPLSIETATHFFVPTDTPRPPTRTPGKIPTKKGVKK